MSHPALHVVVPGPLDQRTGGYIYDARMVDGLRRRRWRVTVHELEGSFPEADSRARSSFATVLRNLPDRSRVMVDGLAMGGLPEVVHEHAGRLRILGLVHHPLADETGLDALRRERFFGLEREALAGCTGVLVTSRSTAARLATYGVPPPAVRAVRPGTTPARRSVGPAAAGVPRLLCVASVIPRKGHDVLIGALERLRDKRWTCVCAGSVTRDRVHAAGLKARVDDAGLEGRIRFVGECGTDKLDELYHESAVFVLASHYEGFGMVLSEALARGLPIVSTTGGAIPDTVPGGAGILVAPSDETALAAALGDLIRDPARRVELASAARRHAATLPDWEQAANAFAEAVLALASDP